MTVSSELNRKEYAGDGSTTAFATSPVVFFDAADLKVYVVTTATGAATLQTITTHYTVSGGDGSTGTVTMVTAPTAAQTLVIVRDVAATQSSDFVNNDINDAEVLEDALDRLTMLAQQSAAVGDRAFRLPDSDTSGITTEVSATGNAGKYLRINAGGTALEFADGDLNTTTITQSGTGAVERTLTSKLGEIITPEDFGAVGDGATDDLTPLTNFFNELISGTAAGGGIMPNKTYAITGALPTINVGKIRLHGYRASHHDTGSPTGTTIKYTGPAGATMLTIAPTEGASAQGLHGLDICGIAFNCNSLAAKGVLMKSVSNSRIDIACYNATDTGFELDCATTLGEATDVKNNQIWYRGRQVEAASGVSLRLKGDGSGNVSFNRFYFVDIQHKDASGIIEECADNNRWDVCRVFRTAAGSATNSIEWLGGATSGASCRNEIFENLTTTVAAIAKGTGTYTVGAQRIFIEHLDKENSTPTPTEETGTTIYDGEWRSYTPTISANTGTFTSVVGTGRYRRAKRLMYLYVQVAITTNGTASVNIHATLPAAAAAAAGTRTFAGMENTTGVMQRGVINSSGTDLIMTSYDATYYGADGRTIQMSGVYETA
jgi:hypothetical protein